MSGEVGVGMLWNGSAAAAQNEGLNLKLVFPKEGGIGWVDNFAISSGAKNVEAAHKMIARQKAKNTLWICILRE